MSSPTQPDNYTPPADGMPFAPIAPDLFPASPTPPAPAATVKTIDLPNWVIVVIAIGLVAVGFGLDHFSATVPLLPAPVPSVPAQTVLQKAADSCNAGEVKDDGKTLVFDMKGEDYGSGEGTFADWECLVDAAKAPQSTQMKMRETRALDGRQADNWTVDGTRVEASWNYHPDDGLDVIFELR